jgi:Zn-finger nucleic acid-binding protein
MKAGPVLLDICQNGCGGIWFDAAELAQLNHAIPTGKKPLAEIIRDPAVTVDAERARKCVRCRGVKLERKLFSLGTGVILDRCPKCAGTWLDHGELETIREETHPTPQAVRILKKSAVRSVPIHFEDLQRVKILRGPK